MPWSKVAEKNVLPAPSEQWDVLIIPATPGVIHNAFRVVVPDTLPLNFGTAGFWCVAQIVAGQLVYSRSHPITIIGRGNAQGLRIMGVQDVDLIAVQNNEFFLAYSIHKWIPRDVIQIWALT